MTGEINRRNFLKIVGMGGVGATLPGCDLPTTVTLEEGKEEVVSYIMPEEYVIPGVGVWYASTCLQCPAGCGIHGRVREGRVLKLEGNPNSQINEGKICQMGLAGVQGHYNPDRITQPLIKENGKLVPTDWASALKILKQKIGPQSGLDGKRVAWFGGSTSGHQSAMIGNLLNSLGSTSHFVHEIVNSQVWQSVCNDTLGDRSPSLNIKNANVILSFGADFLGTWQSPVQFSRQYGEFRKSPNRGTLIQVESKMTLTGGSADLWVAINPGTEGVLALGIANYIYRKSNLNKEAVPENIKALIEEYSISKVAKIVGVAGDRIQRIGRVLVERSPSLVLAGAQAEGHPHGYDSVAAIMLLNFLLGNIGKTIIPSAEFSLPQLQAKSGGTKDLVEFARALKQKQFDIVFFAGANPIYTAPHSLGVQEGIQAIPFKVALAQFPDETSILADLVLPLSSSLEDWGTHVAAYQGDHSSVSIQQPLMENLYADTQGIGDILLSMLKIRDAQNYNGFKDYYSYLRNSFSVLDSSGAVNQESFWNAALQNGVLDLPGKKRDSNSNWIAEHLPEYAKNENYPLRLIPTPRMGLYDGRHANLPWLQESPDQISKVVWDSWAELHPDTASQFGIKHGDIVKISSEHGSIEVKAYVINGIHPDAISVPLGQGHTDYGTYASGVGINPLSILAPDVEQKTGELAMYSTQVKIENTSKHEKFVRLGSTDSQMGRQFVRTMSAADVKPKKGV